VSLVRFRAPLPDMVLIAKEIGTFSAEKINQLRKHRRGCYWWKSITLTVADVEISSQDRRLVGR
jgi:hypothetical protein